LQWALSGNQVVCFGDVILILLKGNRNLGNEIVRIREILLDLRLKVYYIESQTINLNVKVESLLFLFRINYNVDKKRNDLYIKTIIYKKYIGEYYMNNNFRVI